MSQGQCVPAQPPASRSSFAGAHVRMCSTEDRLRSARERLEKVARALGGQYPTDGTDKCAGATGVAAQSTVVTDLHNKIDTLDEEQRYILDAVLALESSIG